MLQRSGRVAGLVERLLSPAKAPPSGPDWLHEIKHDGFASWHGATPAMNRAKYHHTAGFV
jgi:hypothetical protein